MKTQESKNNENVKTTNTLLEELKERLRNGEVKFVFTKKDGTERVALGTTKKEIYGVEHEPKGTGRNKNENTTCYYDLEKQSWRSFVNESLIRIIDDEDKECEDNQVEDDIIKYFGNNEDIKFIFYRFETLSNEQWKSGKIQGKDERELNNTQKTLLLQSAIMKQMVRFTRYYDGDFSLNYGFETSKLFLDFLESKLLTDMKDVVKGIKENFNIDFYYGINEIYASGRTNWDDLLEYHGTPNFKHSLSDMLMKFLEDDVWN